MRFTNVLGCCVWNSVLCKNITDKIWPFELGVSLHIWGDLMTLLEKNTKYDKISENTGFLKFLRIKLYTDKCCESSDYKPYE